MRDMQLWGSLYRHRDYWEMFTSPGNKGVANLNGRIVRKCVTCFLSVYFCVYLFTAFSSTRSLIIDRSAFATSSIKNY